MGYLAGFDVGTSFIKGTLLNSRTGRVVSTYTSPSRELEIYAPHKDWAEQNPGDWWEHVAIASKRLLENVDPADVEGIGISYQMHGLVIVDKDGKVLRPSIIWCDGRTKDLGEKAALKLGPEFLERALNYPGNFTAAKLAWVKQEEPDIYRRIHRAMLPGDYIAMELTGEACTTPSGLSEGIFWDFERGGILNSVFEYFGIDPELLPPIRPTFSVQGEVTGAAAEATGFRKGTHVSYRAGDQPNNAFSLKVLHPGEIATTAGTSGVVCAVTDKRRFDPGSRVNVFAHVNHRLEDPRQCILACVNGAGSAYRWARDLFGCDYGTMNDAAGKVSPGSDGVIVLPHGNGPERTLNSRNTGLYIIGVDVNTHGRGHVARAVQEGVVFAIKQGTDIMETMGARIGKVRAGNSNMFRSDVFCDIFANTLGTEVELFETDGSQGAARGAGVATTYGGNVNDAFVGLRPVRTFSPDSKLQELYRELYGGWVDKLKTTLSP